MKFSIYDALPRGRENAVSLELIQSKFSINAREARRRIETERSHGAPILSSTEGTGGYFAPATSQEAARFAVSQRSRASQILKSARAAEAAARELGEEEKARGCAQWEGAKSQG